MGGIFYDYLGREDPPERLAAHFAFTKDVGLAFLAAFPEVVRRRMREPWTAEEREAQLIRRGRYVEFNLLYDRGTLFGLEDRWQCGGDPDVAAAAGALAVAAAQATRLL